MASAGHVGLVERAEILLARELVELNAPDLGVREVGARSGVSELVAAVRADGRERGDLVVHVHDLADPPHADQALIAGRDTVPQLVVPNEAVELDRKSVV